MNRGRALGPGRLWKRGRLWTLDYRDGEGDRRRVTLSSQKATAERMRSELIHRRDLERAGLGAEAGQGMSLGELLDAYLGDVEPRVTPMHFKNVSQKLTTVVGQLGRDVLIRDLKPADAVRVRSAAAARGRSHRTANLLIGRVQSMLRWAQRNRMIAMNPLEHLDRLPESRDHQQCRRRAMSDAEIARFLEATREDDHRAWLLGQERGYHRVPQLPWWTALLETGARYTEARLATWGDVDLAEGVLVLRAENTKSRKQRAIPLRAGLVDQLRSLRVVHEQALGRLPTIGDAIFLSPKGEPWKQYSTNAMRIFVRLLDRAGIPKANHLGEKLDIHALRHTCNTRLARAGVSIDHRQRLLGHSDPKLTAVTYAHLEVEDLRGAIEKLDERRDAPARRTSG